MKRIAFLVVVSAAFASCAMPRPGDVRLERVYGVQTLGASLAQSRVVVKLGLINDSRARVTLRQADLHFSTPQGEILQALIDEPLVLPARSTSEVDVPLTLRFKGGLGAITAIPGIVRDMENVRVTGVVRLRGGGLSKTYTVQDEPLRDFLRALGVDPENIP